MGHAVDTRYRAVDIYLHTEDDAVAEDELVVLQGEGGEEAGEAAHEAAQHRSQPDGLPPAT